MQFYIHTLPKEELRGMRSKLEARMGQQAEAGVKLVENEAAAKKPRKELTAAERESLKLEIKNKGFGGEEPGGN